MGGKADDICIVKVIENSRDRRDVTALATQVNKCTAVVWTVNFNITGNEKMMKNGPYLIKFADFFTGTCLFRKENFVFCPTTIILNIIASIFHKLLKKTRVWVGWTAIGLRSFRRERNECL